MVSLIRGGSDDDIQICVIQKRIGAKCCRFVAHHEYLIQTAALKGSVAQALQCGRQCDNLQISVHIKGVRANTLQAFWKINTAEALIIEGLVAYLLYCGWQRYRARDTGSVTAP